MAEHVGEACKKLNFLCSDDFYSVQYGLYIMVSMHNAVPSSRPSNMVL